MAIGRVASIRHSPDLGQGLLLDNIKAKTGEGLDAVGRGEALRADAIALIRATRA